MIAVVKERYCAQDLISSSSSHLRILTPKQAFECKESLPIKPGFIWKIEAGVVRSLTWDEEGKLITLGFWGEGDIVGQPLSRMKPYQVECLTPVKAIQIMPEPVRLEEALLIHAWKSEEFLCIIHQMSIPNRLLSLLEWLSRQFGQVISEGILLNLRLTHQDFADTIGTSRVTITRLLNQFEREGKIARSHYRSAQKFSQEYLELSRQSMVLKTLCLR
jgi:CRP-like cAMP-binding protein